MRPQVRRPVMPLSKLPVSEALPLQDGTENAAPVKRKWKETISMESDGFPKFSDMETVPEATLPKGATEEVAPLPSFLRRRPGALAAAAEAVSDVDALQAKMGFAAKTAKKKCKKKVIGKRAKKKHAAASPAAASSLGKRKPLSKGSHGTT